MVRTHEGLPFPSSTAYYHESKIQISNLSANFFLVFCHHDYKFLPSLFSAAHICSDLMFQWLGSGIPSNIGFYTTFLEAVRKCTKRRVYHGT
jgi:hypothetical protein